MYKEMLVHDGKTQAFKVKAEDAFQPCRCHNYLYPGTCPSQHEKNCFAESPAISSDFICYMEYNSSLPELFMAFRTLVNVPKTGRVLHIFLAKKVAQEEGVIMKRPGGVHRLREWCVRLCVRNVDFPSRPVQPALQKGWNLRKQKVCIIHP